MKDIHVYLVSDQPIPNLTTALQLRPDQVILLTTPEMQEKAELLGMVLKRKGIAVESYGIDAYNIKKVIEVSESINERYGDANLLLNITGGTKIGTLGTFQSFYTRGREIVYVDTRNNRMLKLSPENEQEEIPIKVSISIRDYLEVYGFHMEACVKNDAYIYERKELTCYLAELASTRNTLIGQLNGYLHNYNEQSYLPIKAPLPRDNGLCDRLHHLDGIKRLKDWTMLIASYEALRYLKGIWFEEYVYMLTKTLNIDEVKLNVVGRWITKGRHSPRNEFDVLVSKGTRLFYISCKTANPDRKASDSDEGVGREFLYELDSVADHALGLFGKRMIASARKINDRHVRQRAKMLNIEIVDGRNIVTFKEKLRQWIQ